MGGNTPLHAAGEFAAVFIGRSSGERILAAPLVEVSESQGGFLRIGRVHRLLAGHGAQVAVHHRVAAHLARFEIVVVVLHGPDVPAPQNLARIVVGGDAHITVDEHFGGGERDDARSGIESDRLGIDRADVLPSRGTLRGVVPQQLDLGGHDDQIGIGVTLADGLSLYGPGIGAGYAVTLHVGAERVGRTRLAYQIGIGRTLRAQVDRLLAESKDRHVTVELHRRAVQLVVGVADILREDDLLRDLVLVRHDTETQLVAGLQLDGSRNRPEGQLAQLGSRILGIGGADDRRTARERGAQVDLLSLVVDAAGRDGTDVQIVRTGQQLLLVALAGNDGQRNRLDRLVSRQLLVLKVEGVLRDSHHAGERHADFVTVVALDLCLRVHDLLAADQDVEPRIERSSGRVLCRRQGQNDLVRSILFVRDIYFVRISLRNDTGQHDGYVRLE